MKLVKGNDLTPTQRIQVLAAYVHRWTHENARNTYGGRCPGCVQSGKPAAELAKWHAYHKPLQTDAKWLNEHAFYIKADGTLSQLHKHCEPAFLAGGGA